MGLKGKCQLRLHLEVVANSLGLGNVFHLLLLLPCGLSLRRPLCPSPITTSRKPLPVNLTIVPHVSLLPSECYLPLLSDLLQLCSVELNLEPISLYCTF